MLLTLKSQRRLKNWSKELTSQNSIPNQTVDCKGTNTSRYVGARPFSGTPKTWPA